MKIAVLGMGRMGQALAGRLQQSGHELTIWNRTSGKAGDLVGQGAREANSPADAARGNELVMTSLASDDAVSSVASELKSALGENAVYADASTISPALSGELDKTFAHFVAVPILGSPAAVAAGEASYLVGGAEPAARVVGSLFPALSKKVFQYPAPPLASAAKLAVNLLLLDGVVALAESFAVGRAGGLTDDQLRQLLGESPMVAPGLKNRFEGVLTGEQDKWWTAELGAKDARLAIELGREAGLVLPLTAAARDCYQNTPASEDIAAVEQTYRL